MTGEPALLNAMMEHPVPLVIDNNRQFSAVLERGDASQFHPEDAKALEQTYIRFSDDIFIAGREVEAGAVARWQVLVPGTYTVEGELVLDGTRYSTAHWSN